MFSSFSDRFGQLVLLLFLLVIVGCCIVVMPRSSVSGRYHYNSFPFNEGIVESLVVLAFFKTYAHNIFIYTS